MVRAIMIVEVAGNPSEYVKESLEKHVNVLNGIKDVTINSMNISEPKEIENSNGIFTCFSEIDFEVENFSRMTEIIFDFMPSSVEVIVTSFIPFRTLTCFSKLSLTYSEGFPATSTIIIALTIKCGREVFF